MAPPYYFSIKEMRQKVDSLKRISRRGWRLPPKALGNNQSQPVMHFHHTGHETMPVGAIPPNAPIHRTWSIYIFNATVWTIDYDATEWPVQDGVETPSSTGTSEDCTDVPDDSSNNSDEGDDWVSMSFEHRDDSVSYVGRRLEHWQLCAMREEQLWARDMLSDLYRPHGEELQGHRQGGLIGCLPLIIGLVALAVPENEVGGFLPQVMQRSWCFDLTNNQRRGAGWWNGRGVVVTTYADELMSTVDELNNYEEGHSGPILS